MMPYLALLWFPALGAVGLWLWFLRDVYRKFGLEGLALKSALMIDGGFLVYAVASYQLPETGIPEYLGDGPFYCAFVLLGFWIYLLFANRPMRWLMKPPVCWVIYGLAALFYTAAFAAEKGWR